MKLKHQYEIGLVAQRTGALLGRRAVPEDHLERCREWVRFQAQRRAAVADGDAGEILDEPCFADEHEGRIEAMTIRIGDGPQPFEHRFTSHTFRSVADAFLEDVVAAGGVDRQTPVAYRVFARSVPESPSPNGVTAKVRRHPLPLTAGRLGDCLAHATLCGALADDDYPLFLREGVVPQSVKRSWAGRDVEGGAWLVGNLYRQHEPPEIFGVIHTVLEAVGMTHEKDQLDLSAQTYLHLQEQLDRRRNRMGREGELLMGFIHSHPFTPATQDGREDCQGCAERNTCTATSAFLSRRDARFHTAVFGSAPYAVQLVLGLTPREEFDLRMFSLDGGQFRERGFYCLATATPST
jgi:hypothetical protein